MITTESAGRGGELMRRIVRSVDGLYSMPAVAAEVLELTRNSQIDVHALRLCIERDPALVVKLLRVVNSPALGLGRRITDLDEALALLGVKPLNLLVLGFSLPDGLTRDLGAEALGWYWKNTLSRAVAAQALAQTLQQTRGSEAFLAGLLQDVGVLALVRVVRGPYLDFLNEVIKNGADLHRLEVASLGFDHTELSAELLRHWHMPPVLADAIDQPRVISVLSLRRDEAGRIAQAIHVADLAAQVASARRWEALPELMEAGQTYFGMGQVELLRLMEALEPKIRQVADALSIGAVERLDVAEAIAEAHVRLAAEAEHAVVTRGCALATGLHEAALALAAQHAQAPAANLRRRPPAFPEQARQAVVRPVAAGPLDEDAGLPRRDELLAKLAAAADACRARRQALSVAMLAVGGSEALENGELDLVERAIGMALSDLPPDCEAVAEQPVRRMVLLPGYDRQEAVHRVAEWLERLRQAIDQLAAARRIRPCVVGAGVAAAAIIPRNFAFPSLAETARRCAAAALLGRTGGVKSLEIC